MEPHWLIVAAISAVFGWLIPFTVNLVRSIPRLFRKHAVLGDWYEYHYNFINGKPELFSGTVHIRRGILKQFKAFFEVTDAGLSYKGYGWIERDDLLFNFNCREHDESPLFRFPGIIESNNDILPGIWLAFDHDTKVASGVIVLSKRKLNKRTVLAILSEKSICSEKHRLIRVE